LNRAFQIDFKDHANYMSFLENQLSKVSNSSENYYNYLPVVQSSGYGSTGYPPATLKSDVMLKEIKEATDIERVGKQFLEGAIFFDESSALLDIKINQAYKDNQDNDNKPFRAIRRALYFFSKYAYGILTDTNSSVANLAPSKDKDSSARKYDRNIHKPFIYIVTQDCL
ncbi:12513_t:CDS:2, partial [Funneliformis geosporum]